MYFKKLLGERCYLSPLNLQDYEIYTKWINDIDVSLGVTFVSVLMTPEQEKEILEKLSRVEYNFAIVELKKMSSSATLVLPISTLSTILPRWEYSLVTRIIGERLWSRSHRIIAGFWL